MKKANRLRGRKRLLSGILAAVFLLGGCGGESGNSWGTADSGENGTGYEAAPGQMAGGGEPLMGRYLEEEILAEEDFIPLDLFPVGQEICLTRDFGMDVTVNPLTNEVRPISYQELPEAFLSILQEYAGSISQLVTAENGARMFEIYDFGESADSYCYLKYFLTAQGELAEWKDYVGDGESSHMWYGKDGYFYVAGWKWPDNTSSLYRVNAETGETEYLWELPMTVTYLSVCGDYLFAGGSEELLLYSLSTGEQLSTDSVLEQTVEKALTNEAAVGNNYYLIVPGESEEIIYVLTREGLYRHVMYGSVMERVIDGSLCSIGNITDSYAGLWAFSGENGEMPVFFLAYASGRLVCYRYHEDVTTVPETTVRVYSLYNDNNIRQAITGYQSMHPELYIQYDVGIDREGGITREDALKNLATELGSGSGPDILVMDGIPYDTYVKRGVLANLKESMVLGDGQYFDRLIQVFERDGGLYAVPMGFNIPVLMGDREKIADADNLEKLAELLESTSTEGTAKLGLLSEESVLEVLGQLSCGQWVDEKGELDREALADFLNQCGRIWRADRADMSQESLEEQLEERTLARWGYTGSTEAFGFRNQQMYAPNSLILNHMWKIPYAVGSMGGDTIMGLNDMLGLLKTMGAEMDFRLLSDGQRACVPCSLLALNNASAVPGEAEDFLKYALSAEFQQKAVLDGVPINRDALMAMEENPYVDVNGNPDAEPYAYMQLELENIAIGVPISWASAEEMEAFNQLLDSLDSVSLCDQVVYETVKELGVQAVNGEKSVDETVEEIAKKLELYLAE